MKVTFVVAWCWTITCHGMTFEEVKRKYELLPAGSEDYLILPALRSLAQAAFAGALLYGNQIANPRIYNYLTKKRASRPTVLRADRAPHIRGLVLTPWTRPSRPVGPGAPLQSDY